MDLNTLDLYRKERELCLVVADIKMVSSTMDNGSSTLKMDGVSYKTKPQDIDTLDLGRKIRKMDMAENKL